MVLAVHWPFSFEQPEWLWLMATIPLIVAISLRSFAGLDRSRRIVALILRSLVIIVLAAALARIQFVKRNDNVAVIFMLDRSRSIPEKLRLFSQKYVRAVAAGAQPDDRLGLIGFDGRADVDLIPSRGGKDLMNLVTFSMSAEPDRTDLATALRMAMASFPEGYGRRVVVLTDGNENMGNFAEEMETARANGVAVDVLPLKYSHANEILFDRITVPAYASQDTRVPVRLVIKSRKRTRVKLDLYHNDEPVPLTDSILELAGGMRPDPFTIPIEVHSGGVHRFDARLTPLSPAKDSVVENNQATAFTFVEAPGKVLILTQPESPHDQYLYDALMREKIEVEMRTTDQLEIDLAKLMEYSVVMLANVPADVLTETQHKQLASYVKDQGGGLIMVGGDQSFGAGGWIGSAVEEVSPVTFEVRHKKVMPRGALAIIMHSCEIPRGNYWGEQVGIAAVKAISSRDYLGVICYSWSKGGPNWDVPLAPAGNKSAIIRAIKNMQIGDMPDFATTMDIAVKDLMALNDVSQRHMIIISDGDPRPPSNATLNKMVKNKITCSTVGIGFGSHVYEPTLKNIARKTNPKGLRAYYPVKNPRKLPQIFVKEAKVIKRALIDEELFQPRISGISPIVKGFATQDLPPLAGIVLTTRKPDAIMPIARRTTDGDDPVLAHWNYEMGKMAVFTSGLWAHDKWGGQWTHWAAFGKFWKQVVESVMRQAQSADFDVMTRLDGNKGYVLIEALNKDASFLNFLRISGGKVILPNMDARPLRMAQTGPGRYEATFDVNDNGNYLIALPYLNPLEEGDEPRWRVIRAGLSVPYSPEYRELGTNMDLLQRAAELTGGRVLESKPDPELVFRHDIPPTESRQPIWDWIIKWLLLPLFILDVAGRRLASVLAMSIYVELAVFVVMCAALHTGGATPMGYVGALILAELVGWTIRYRYILPTIQFFTSTVTALSRAGQRSAESLTQLKDVRDRVREDMEEEQPRIPTEPSVEMEPAADPAARFDVGDEKAAKQAGDLTEAVGGATMEDENQAAQVEPSKSKQAAPGDLAARLKRAKRRARDQMRDQAEDDK